MGYLNLVPKLVLVPEVCDLEQQKLLGELLEKEHLFQGQEQLANNLEDKETSKFLEVLMLLSVNQYQWCY